MKEIDSRTSLLLGEEGLSKIQDSEVAVFGLGGVGGTAFLSLARAGVKKIHAVDFDVVEESNLNRQILFGRNDLGKKKSEIAVLRAKEIRDDIDVIGEDKKVSLDNLGDYSSCDFIIDAIDDIEGKKAIILYCLEKGIPFAISLGMGNRLDPSKVQIGKLDTIQGDPLAKILRHDLRKMDVDLSKITCVYSTEVPIKKGNVVSSMMMVPSEAGLLLSYLAFSSLKS